MRATLKYNHPQILAPSNLNPLHVIDDDVAAMHPTILIYLMTLRALQSCLMGAIRSWISDERGSSFSLSELTMRKLHTKNFTSYGNISVNGTKYILLNTLNTYFLTHFWVKWFVDIENQTISCVMILPPVFSKTEKQA